MSKLMMLVIFVASAIITADAFGGTSHRHRSLGPLSLSPTASFRLRQGQRLRLQALESDNENESNSKQLLSLLSVDDDEKEQGEDKIKDEITSLESSFQSSDSDGDKRFDPLIGLYEVKSVLTKNKKENPVGGKWTRKNGLAQKLFQTRTNFQHLLPLNATGLSLFPSEAVCEAINVVSLDALNGLWRITVILRGDAVPLSSEELIQMNTNRTITSLTNLAVRAYFDPPRIFFGRRKKRKGNTFYSYLPLQLGPKSSVVLDTTYYDEAVRVGMGGTSGTRFVFTTTDVEEAKEYEELLSQPAGNTKIRALTKLCGILAASLYVASGKTSASVGIDKLAVFASRLANIIANAKATAIALNLMKTMGLWVKPALRIVAGMASVVSGIAMMLILFSSGGIERDGMSRSPSP